MVVEEDELISVQPLCREAVKPALQASPMSDRKAALDVRYLTIVSRVEQRDGLRALGFTVRK